MNNTESFWFEYKGKLILLKPVSRSGWTLVISYTFFLVWSFLRIDGASHSSSDTLISFVPLLTSTLILILFLLFYYKRIKMA